MIRLDGFRKVVIPAVVITVAKASPKDSAEAVAFGTSKAPASPKDSAEAAAFGTSKAP